MKQSEARALIESKVTINENGCWIWPTNRTYGAVTAGSKRYAAHRLAYMAYHGAIGGKHVLHRCDVTQCVNPEHLFLGDHIDNMADMVAKDRSSQRELSNVRGKFTDEQIREMRKRYERGFPICWLAKDYGSSYAYMWAIIHKYPTGKLGYTRHYADRTG